MDTNKIIEAMNNLAEVDELPRHVSDIHYEYICKLFRQYGDPSTVSYAMIQAAQALILECSIEDRNAFFKQLGFMVEAADHANRRINMILDTAEINNSTTPQEN